MIHQQDLNALVQSALERAIDMGFVNGTGLNPDLMGAPGYRLNRQRQAERLLAEIQAALVEPPKEPADG